MKIERDIYIHTHIYIHVDIHMDIDIDMEPIERPFSGFMFVWGV